MFGHTVDSALCVALLLGPAVVMQGCGGPGKPEEVDAGGREVNTGDPCSVCKSPEAQGRNAGDLNNGDFTVFCNSKQCNPDGTEDAAATVAEGDAEVHKTDKSPSLCDICNRPDAQGHYAGALNDDDFEVKCTKECPNFQHPGPSLAAQQKNNTERTFITKLGGGCFFVFLVALALKAFVVKTKEPLLAGYSEYESDAHYVRVVS